MKRLWKVFRAIVSALLLIAVGVPTLLYVFLSFDSVQDRVRSLTSQELSHVLGVRVEIGTLRFRPFNRVTLRDLAVTDSTGRDTMATVDRVSAGLEMGKLLRQGKVVVDYAVVDGLKLHISRADSIAPLNIQPVLDHLRSDTPRERATPFELKINTVIVRDASGTYDVLSAPLPEGHRFDPNHIAITDLDINAFIPTIANDRLRIDLDHLSARERCGFELSRLSARLSMADSLVKATDLNIELNRTVLNFDSLSLFLGNGMDESLRRHPLQLRTAPGSSLYAADFSPFLPALSNFDEPLELNLDAVYNVDSLKVYTLRLLSRAADFDLECSQATLVPADRANISYDLPGLDIAFTGGRISHMLRGFVDRKTAASLARIPSTRIKIKARGNTRAGNVDLRSHIGRGALELAADYRRHGRGIGFDADLSMEGLNLGSILHVDDLGAVSGDIQGSGDWDGTFTGEVRADFGRVNWHGYDYTNLMARLNVPRGERFEATVTLDDPNATALIYAFVDRNGEVPTLNATASLANISPEALGYHDPKPGYRSGAKLIVSLKGAQLDDLSGNIDITDLRCMNSRNHGLRIPRLSIAADAGAEHPYITLRSDLLKGDLRGPYKLRELPGQLRNLAAVFLPALFDGHDAYVTDAVNNFSFDFTLNSTEHLSEFFGLPAAVVAPARISGFVNSEANEANVEVDAPYIVKGDKIFKSNLIFARLDGNSGLSNLYLTTQFPTKKGEMVLAGTLKAANNRVDTNIDWTIERRIPLNGTIDFSTEIGGLAPEGADWLLPLRAVVNFNPSTINFGYETWEIHPSQIAGGRNIDVRGFSLDAGEQHVAINGTVSSAPTDSLTVDLHDVQLLPIFETLEIDKAMLSGSATGTFKAASLLSDDRYLECPHLMVDSIGYNRCTIGDADILARWDGEKQSFYLDADIQGDLGRSHIAGDIFPFTESLDLNFDADRVPVGFLKPFMEAFAKDISGRASGKCRLFGTFKEIDLTGDVYAENISLAIDFTNTVYTTSDSVHMVPGHIIVPPTTMYDRDGHTARISGWVDHIFFKQPSFRFDVTEADNLLTYNINRNQNPDWYGTIYADGSASVYGEPGIVNIEADMTTSPKTTFTFVLSDRLDAADYTFLEFRDVTPDSLRITAQAVSDEPLIVQQLRNRLENNEQDEPSDYNMRLSVDVTPGAEIDLVMDEASGDYIKAHGAGHITMTYNSADEDLKLYGSYTVAAGEYHFTLQDLIIRDFIIEDGSKINFDGDPYAIRADISAYYPVSANLSDLDKSFQQDRDVASTSVNVHAKMFVKGDIRQPDVSFDLDFPKFQGTDLYRKVRSIVSTNEMMNRQIVYLLALNRFYTPDYMDTTKGSELFSVASSTISSQLSSVLGKISDKWSIAPNLRSDRGDFSDVEVDVALSSRLFNDRLLLNGNFGYRDKTVSTNQFVGDFDIEYLLTPRGTWRLKAYNRYNDANYYLRSAATTQGVGIVYRRDFDNPFSFLRRKHTPAPQPTDTIHVTEIQIDEEP